MGGYVQRDPSSERERLDVVVVGAGQAGLAMGHLLAEQGRPFVILEAANSVGAAWRTRWDSLVLFTSRRYSGLAGLPFPGDPDGYPKRDEVIAYLERYAEGFELPIELDSQVRSLTRRGDAWLVGLDGRTVEADNVVVATGPFQAPKIPAIGEELSSDVRQLHSTEYRRPSDIPPGGTVLVVGGGNTGYQLAKELASSHDVHLAVGSRQMPLPQRVLRRDLFWWLTKTGIINKTADSRIGRRARERDSLIGSSPRQLRRRYGVAIRPRVAGATERTVVFTDGSELAVDTVIWATGYRSDYSWIDAPVLDETGKPRHRRGVTDAPGLYFLGLTWQHTRGSALIGWVKDDARHIAEQIAARQTAHRHAGA